MKGFTKVAIGMGIGVGLMAVAYELYKKHSFPNMSSDNPECLECEHVMNCRCNAHTFGCGECSNFAHRCDFEALDEDDCDDYDDEDYDGEDYDGEDFPGFGEDEEDTEDTGDESFPGFEPMDERSLADTAKRFGIHHHDIPEHFIHSPLEQFDSLSATEDEGKGDANASGEAVSGVPSQVRDIKDWLGKFFTTPTESPTDAESRPTTSLESEAASKEVQEILDKILGEKSKPTSEEYPVKEADSIDTL